MLTSVIGMVIALPVAVAVGLFITQIAPAWLRRPLSYLVDLLAAVPSVVYGFWGIFALIPALHPIASFLISTLGNVPGIGGGVRRPVLRGVLLRRRGGAGDHGAADRHRDLPGGLRHRPGR